jgi:hypothetical protein
LPVADPLEGKGPVAMVKALPVRATRAQTSAGCVCVTHWNCWYVNPEEVPPCCEQTLWHRLHTTATIVTSCVNKAQCFALAMIQGGGRIRSRFAQAQPLNAPDSI